MSSPLLQRSLKNPIYEHFFQKQDFQYLHDYLHNKKQNTRLLITKHDQNKENKPEKKEKMETLKERFETHLITFNPEDDSQFVTYNLYFGKKKNSQLFILGKMNGKNENENIESQSLKKIFQTHQKIFKNESLETEFAINCSTILEKDPMSEKEKKKKIDVYLISRPLIIPKQLSEIRETSLDFGINKNENENENKNKKKDEDENKQKNDNEDNEVLRFPTYFVSNLSSNDSEESSLSTTSTDLSSDSEVESVAKEIQNPKMKKTKENESNSNDSKSEDEEVENKNNKKNKNQNLGNKTSRNTNESTNTINTTKPKSEAARLDIIQNFEPYTKLPLISKYIQKCAGVCLKISEMETIPEITSQNVLEFVEYAAEKCQDEKVFPEIELKAEKYEKIKEFFLEYIMRRISSKVFVSIKEKCKTKDKMLKQKLGKLQFVGYQDLGIDPKIYDQEIFERSQKILEKVNDYVTPNEKLECIKESCLLLSELFKGQTSGADDFLPCLVYCLLLTNPKKLQSNITFIESYSDFEMISHTAEGYYFTNLSSSKHFLENLSYDDVNVDPLSFLLRKEGKSELNLIKNKLREFNLDNNKKSPFSLNPKKKRNKKKRKIRNKKKKKNKKPRSQFEKSEDFLQDSLWGENDKIKFKNNDETGNSNRIGNNEKNKNDNQNNNRNNHSFDFNFEFNFNNFLKNKTINKQKKLKRPNSVYFTGNSRILDKKFQFQRNNNNNHNHTNNTNNNKRNIHNSRNISNNRNPDNKQLLRTKSYHISKNKRITEFQKSGFIIINTDNVSDYDNKINNNTTNKNKNKKYSKKKILKEQYPFYHLSPKDITVDQIPLLLSTYKKLVDKYEKNINSNNNDDGNQKRKKKKKKKKKKK
ncbi:rab gdp/gtp exchange factor [Anaeramoeba flamelloides]|uniref:Rab gdp/gtp exchange factor n=1 Tax=Anaeramoeba flamelloides TaxID=1746091 RepID=A0AAV7ZD19_9EUKA|nr:rab gdp/gtp exchange factor [Anaeramoeba flamelloides]